MVKCLPTVKGLPGPIAVLKGVGWSTAGQGTWSPSMSSPDPIDEASRDSCQYSEALEARLPSSMRLRLTGFYSRMEAQSLGRFKQDEGLELFFRHDFTHRVAGFASYTLVLNRQNPIILPSVGFDGWF